MNPAKTKNVNFTKKKAVTVLGQKLFFCIVFLLAIFSVPIVKADSVGDNKTFLIDASYDYNDRSEITATLKKVGLNAYFYVEDDYYNNLSSGSKLNFDSHLNSLSSNFDNIVYPKTREVFGYEWSPGIDNDERITILFTETKENVGGYFNPNDEYKKENITGGKSNEREMFYLNPSFIGDKRIRGFLAHEFQHMITWYHKMKLRGISDDIWLNECRSEYAPTAIGYDDSYPSSNLSARIKNFLLNSDDSLTEWKNEINDYSSVNLFSQYLADHYGEAIFKTMIENDKTGIESINKALASLGYSNVDFRNVFTNWTIANYLNDAKLSADSKYGYKNPNLQYDNLHLSPTESYIVNNSNAGKLTAEIKDWSVKYYEFEIAEDTQENNIIEIDFDGENSGNFSVPYVVYYSDETKRVNKLSLNDNQDSKIRVNNFGKNISSVLTAPSSQKRETGFGDNIESYSFSISVKLTEVKTYPDGSLLRASDSEKVYLIENGKKRWVDSSAAFVLNGYQWDDVILVVSDELKLYESGENISVSDLKDDGSLIKGTGDKVYLIEGGEKRWITTLQTFIFNEYSWEKVITVFDEELDLYPDGKNIYAPNIKSGDLVKINDDEKIYLIENNKKRWITTDEVFVLRGYNWKDIVIISEKELDMYTEGREIR